MKININSNPLTKAEIFKLIGHSLSAQGHAAGKCSSVVCKDAIRIEFAYKHEWDNKTVGRNFICIERNADDESRKTHVEKHINTVREKGWYLSHMFVEVENNKGTSKLKYEGLFAIDIEMSLATGTFIRHRVDTELDFDKIVALYYTLSGNSARHDFKD